MREEQASADWKESRAGESVEQQWQEFSGVIREARQKFIPRRREHAKGEDEASMVDEGSQGQYEVSHHQIKVQQLYAESQALGAPLLCQVRGIEITSRAPYCAHPSPTPASPPHQPGEGRGMRALSPPPRNPGCLGFSGNFLKTSFERLIAEMRTDSMLRLLCGARDPPGWFTLVPVGLSATLHRGHIP